MRKRKESFLPSFSSILRKEDEVGLLRWYFCQVPPEKGGGQSLIIGEMKRRGYSPAKIRKLTAPRKKG